MVVAGDHVLWSYVFPVKDKGHHACVMIYNPGSQPRPLITSQFPASDYMIYNHEEDIYLIERRYIAAENSCKSRLLMTDLSGNVKVLWPWFDDKWRIGEGGFIVNKNSEIIFVRYPSIYKIKKGAEPTPYFKTDVPIKRMREIDTNHVLLLSDDGCMLTDKKGLILKQWSNLLEAHISNAPLKRNQIFDADYKDDTLLIAYWGKRSFETVDSKGNRTVIKQQKEPFAPHWVAFFGSDQLLFSSKLEFNGNNPLPRLIHSGAKEKIIWAIE